MAKFNGCSGMDSHSVRTRGHYYDLFQISEKDEVLAMPRSEEYSTIKTDYDRISQEHFAKRYFPPADMSFAQSETLFPSADLGSALGGVQYFGNVPRYGSESKLEFARGTRDSGAEGT
ncbi:MAG TPA: hypothetical protein VK579_19675 [Terriglobales bacterium]|nr:hypothetical protein [Terriglobales bacterium]